MNDESQGADTKLKILRWLRWLAIPLVGILLFGAIRDLNSPPFDPPWFFRVRAGLEILLGLILLLPFQKIGQKFPRLWTKAFLVLLIVCVAFVFLRVIGVLFEARAVEALGGELGLPAWSGTLIFLVLAQVPVVLFQRFPDQMD
ncbi:hypothetical protein [Puniceicoccus vermicola]|uniref:Uncharacterized protein n=1 Tax=Puniceicoccus vermicola TaxID=388746 RepID=A0A7X1AVX7_9BACT|nr:hypothetical protein [Puniceicoccus vermicola]MBC2600827.1 hypothetical protein [Puniceicoccus vermicola]